MRRRRTISSPLVPQLTSIWTTDPWNSTVICLRRTATVSTCRTTRSTTRGTAAQCGATSHSIDLEPHQHAGFGRQFAFGHAPSNTSRSVPAHQRPTSIRALSTQLKGKHVLLSGVSVRTNDVVNWMGCTQKVADCLLRCWLRVLLLFHGFAVLCKVGGTRLAPDGSSVELQNVDALEQTTGAKSHHLLKFFVSSGGGDRELLMQQFCH